MLNITEKTWLVDEDYAPLTMVEMAENVTRAYARRVMNDAEFAMFCDLQNAFMEKNRAAALEYARTHYYPGCYGDALTDC